MLSRSETETIRAALRYWKEEIAAHDELARLYLPQRDVQPLVPDQVETLIRCFQWQKLRFVKYQHRSNRVVSHYLLSQRELQTVADRSEFLTTILR